MFNYRWMLAPAIVASGMLVAATSSFGLSQTQLMEYGSPSAVEAAIKGKASVETRDKDGATPLMIAAGFNQDPKVISALLNAGAKVDDQARGNVTPLMYAALNRDPRIASALLKAGANVNAREWDGETPLMIASAYNQNPDVVSTLLKAGAGVGQRDSHGMTPLMFAALNPNPAIIPELIRAGARVADQDNNGRTPLMWAAMDGQHPRAVSVLLAAGATGQLTSKDGKTAYDYAAMNPDLKGTKQLQELKTAAQTAHGQVGQRA